MHAHQSPIRPVLALGVALFAALLIGPVVALSHAELDTVTPADKASVSTPNQIVMTFTERLDPSKSSITVVDAGGATVAQGGTVPASDPAGEEMDLAIATPLPVGTYEIRWTTFSADDQEFDRGTTTFTVVAGSAVNSSNAPASAAAPATVTPSAPPATAATSTSDAIIPVVVALIVLAALGLWLMRGRSRRAR